MTNPSNRDSWFRGLGRTTGNKADLKSGMRVVRTAAAQFITSLGPAFNHRWIVSSCFRNFLAETVANVVQTQMFIFTR